MIQHLLAPAHARIVADLLGESERSVRWLLRGSLMVAVVAVAAWLGTLVDLGWLPERNIGSARVAQAFIGLAAFLFAGIAAGLLAAGMLGSARRALPA